MSGHSKWHNIKEKKGLADAKKAILFTKLGRNITVAAKKGGGSPDSNVSLRIAIDLAKEGNMPKDKIERAIKKGTGELKEGAMIEELTYEGYGPGQVALIIEALSDNRNRTASDLKHVVAKHGGKLEGNVSWMFHRKGVIVIPKLPPEQRDHIELQFIEAGADDIIEEGETLVIITSPQQFHDVKLFILEKEIKILHEKLEFRPKEIITISGNDAEALKKLFEDLDEHEDVNDYYTNALLP